jgi:hypothetical protein
VICESNVRMTAWTSNPNLWMKYKLVTTTCRGYALDTGTAPVRKEAVPMSGSAGKKGGKPSSSKGHDNRRADNGQYTTDKYAKAHPKTTIRETRKK